MMGGDQMSDERRLTSVKRLGSLGLDLEASQDETLLKIPCVLTEECKATEENSLSLDLRKHTFRCSNCHEHGSFEDLVRMLEDSKVTFGRIEPAHEDQEYGVALRAEPGAVLVAEPKVRLLGPDDRIPPPPPPPPRPHRNLGERIIITLLALVFLGAGLSAAALSGFANYQTFSSSVTDPLQAGIWGWTGVIAAVISFGGFTFFYWHTANKRMKEGVRALLFALAGAGTSILGTQMYIAANNQASQAEITTAGTNRVLLEQQLSDWRVQLAGIPPETRSVEGLEAYISEVERVGRTEQKPYRDAQNELGLARRRDDLQAKIETANSELLGKGNGDILIETQARAAIPSWFFAGMLELFSSQGTSIGLVALLILYTRRREPPSPLVDA
jgi:hypothetical protein